MIIDKILDRRDSGEYTWLDAKDIYDYAMFFKMDYLSRALDYGTNEEVQKALCKYIIENEYNKNICNYVMSVRWV